MFTELVPNTRISVEQSSSSSRAARVPSSVQSVPYNTVLREAPGIKPALARLLRDSELIAEFCEQRFLSYSYALEQYRLHTATVGYESGTGIPIIPRQVMTSAENEALVIDGANAVYHAFLLYPGANPSASPNLCGPILLNLLKFLLEFYPKIYLVLNTSLDYKLSRWIKTKDISGVCKHLGFTPNLASGKTPATIISEIFPSVYVEVVTTYHSNSYGDLKENDDRKVITLAKMYNAHILAGDGFRNVIEANDGKLDSSVRLWARENLSKIRPSLTYIALSSSDTCNLRLSDPYGGIALPQAGTPLQVLDQRFTIALKEHLNEKPVLTVSVQDTANGFLFSNESTEKVTLSHGYKGSAITAFQAAEGVAINDTLSGGFGWFTLGKYLKPHAPQKELENFLQFQNLQIITLHKLGITDKCIGDIAALRSLDQEGFYLALYFIEQLCWLDMCHPAHENCTIEIVAEEETKAGALVENRNNSISQADTEGSQRPLHAHARAFSLLADSSSSGNKVTGSIQEPSSLHRSPLDTGPPSNLGGAASLGYAQGSASPCGPELNRNTLSPPPSYEGFRLRYPYFQATKSSRTTYNSPSCEAGEIVSLPVRIQVARGTVIPNSYQYRKRLFFPSTKILEEFLEQTHAAPCCHINVISLGNDDMWVSTEEPARIKELLQIYLYAAQKPFSQRGKDLYFAKEKHAFTYCVQTGGTALVDTKSTYSFQGASLNLEEASPEIFERIQEISSRKPGLNTSYRKEKLLDFASKSRQGYAHFGYPSWGNIDQIRWQNEKAKAFLPKACFGNHRTILPLPETIGCLAKDLGYLLPALSSLRLSEIHISDNHIGPEALEILIHTRLNKPRTWLRFERAKDNNCTGIISWLHATGFVCPKFEACCPQKCKFGKPICMFSDVSNRQVITERSAFSFDLEPTACERILGVGEGGLVISITDEPDEMSVARGQGHIQPLNLNRKGPFHLLTVRQKEALLMSIHLGHSKDYNSLLTKIEVNSKHFWTPVRGHSADSAVASGLVPNQSLYYKSITNCGEYFQREMSLPELSMTSSDIRRLYASPGISFACLINEGCIIRCAKRSEDSLTQITTTVYKDLDGVALAFKGL
jgi:hypothetical protein